MPLRIEGPIAGSAAQLATVLPAMALGGKLRERVRPGTVRQCFFVGLLNRTVTKPVPQ